ncbi:hypothetical protein NB706_003191 [Xanthomonas sacchari]|nr:hypothetical protein [Xanthomonas sacchari]
MQRQRGEAELLQRSGDLVDLLAGVAEHHAGLGGEAQQQAGHRLLPVSRVDLEELLVDLRRAVGAFDGDFRRFLQQVPRQGADFLWEGGREQQALPVLVAAAGDLADRLLEAHVEHAVGLVQHQRAHPAQVQRALARQLLDAAGRADHHLRVVRLQRGQLRRQRHAAGQHHQFHVGNAGGQLAQLLADLVGQFAGRAQHQRLRAAQRRIQLVQQAQAERRGLAAAGRRLHDDVLAGQDRRQALLLHRGHAGVAERVDAGRERRGKGEGGEIVHAAF